MSLFNWINSHCKFAQATPPEPEPAQPQDPTRDPNDPNVMKLPTKPERLPSSHLEDRPDLILPAGSVLFHGSIEEFEESQLGIGGYDKVLWTTDDKNGPGMAQSYIPMSGSSTLTSPRHLYLPTDSKSMQHLQRQLGIFYDYETPGAIEFDRGRATSWRSPKKADGSTWGFEELTPAVVDQLLRQKGYKPKYNDGGDPAYNGYEIRHRNNMDEVMEPNEQAMGRLFILRAQQPLKIYDYAKGREGDLMEPDYHKLNMFRAAEAGGYDGIRINDFAQVENWGNVGHRAIGIFPKSISKLKWETIPAAHPKLDRLGDSTPEWQEYMKKQQPPTAQAWVRAHCKFAQGSPAMTCLEFIKTNQAKEAASYFRSLPVEQQGDVAAEMARMIQAEDGGFAGWDKRDEAGEPHPPMPDMQAFWDEVKRLDLGWKR